MILPGSADFVRVEPASIATEEKIGRADMKVVNLRVTATGSDEWFDVLRGLALLTASTGIERFSRT